MAYSIHEMRRMSFDGVAFPYQRVSIKGGLRYHIHEYPHVHGGSLEKLGRRLYEIRVATRFDSRSIRDSSVLWPATLDGFCDWFEQGKSRDLFIPWIGTIKACCVNWSRELNIRAASGEDVEFEFVEDMDEALRVSSALVFKSNTFNTASGKWATLEREITPRPNIFDMINSAVNVVLAAMGTQQMWTRLVIAKIEGLIGLIKLADKTVKELNDPLNHEVLDALLDLWLATQQLGKDVTQQGNLLKQWTTPRIMTVGEAATAIYGSTQRASEIMQLNALEDPYAIPANFDLFYFAAA